MPTPTASRMTQNMRFKLVMAWVLVWCLWGTAVRMAMNLAFAPPGFAHTDAWGALALGLRFDLRVALWSVLGLWLLCLLPWVGQFFSRRRWWLAMWLLCSLLILLVGVVDIGHYAYLSQRLSATLLSLIADPREATGMVWQTYPVIWITLAMVAAVFLQWWIFQRIWRWACPVPSNTGNDTGRVLGRKERVRHVLLELAALVLAAGCIHGQWSQYPLRWSNTVALPHPFAQQLALNPLHNLFDTWSFRSQMLSPAHMSKDADTMRAFLGLPPNNPGEPLSFLRNIPARNIPSQPKDKPLNVVLVLMESFAAHKTGALGSPAGATPAFDDLAKQGLLFTRMMSAHAHTARGVFATLTGIPDVSDVLTASRNPSASNQQSIVNEFTAHDKLYFIGGSTSWANVRGVLTSSIDGIEIVEQTQLKSPVVDVWGVSDKNLFLEASDKLSAKHRAGKPFFAIIQTSGNHRPYTIPNEDLPHFNPPTPDAATLSANGFISLEEYRAFAYLDWCVGQFMAQAKKSNYFDDTVFAFVGDHGIIGATGPHLPRAWRDLSITQGHTPFLIYAPKHIAPKRIDHWAQQVDVLPTLAAITGQAHRNTTLGRDLLDPRFDAEQANTRAAFYFQYAGNGQIGFLFDRYMINQAPVPSVLDVLSDTPSQNLLLKPTSDNPAPMLHQRWGPFAQAYRNAALYLQTHNPKLSKSQSHKQ